MRTTLPTVVTAAGRQYDYWATVYKRTWRGTVVSSFVTPLLYVLAMGVLLGGFIKGDPATLEGASSYLVFIAPGLLAAQSMQSAVGETTYPVMACVKWKRVYFGMNATPLRPGDIVTAHLGFLVFRLATVTGVFMLALAPFDVYASVLGAVGAWLVSILIGMAIGIPVYAFSVGAPSEEWFALIFRLGVIPQFLFSGAFFPIANLNPTLGRIARLTPLWHGVDLTRMLTLGTLEAGPALVHLAYLLALVVLGHRLAVRRLTTRLAI
jgi:lipooligosaccharide transport system permease protein